jgi:hypothetical protein
MKVSRVTFGLSDAVGSTADTAVAHEYFRRFYSIRSSGYIVEAKAFHVKLIFSR